MDRSNLSGSCHFDSAPIRKAAVFGTQRRMRAYHDVVLLCVLANQMAAFFLFVVCDECLVGFSEPEQDIEKPFQQKPTVPRSCTRP